MKSCIKFYTDQELDGESGLYNYNARLYDPMIGRFISPDTIIPQPYNPQSLNRYTYVLNNPLIYTDPSGHQEEEYTLAPIYVIGSRNEFSWKEWDEAMEALRQDIDDYYAGLVRHIIGGWGFSVGGDSGSGASGSGSGEQGGSTGGSGSGGGREEIGPIAAEVMGTITTISVSIFTKVAQNAKVITSAHAGFITGITAPLSDLLYPRSLNMGEDKWLFLRALEVQRKNMDRLMDEIDAYYYDMSWWEDWED